MYCLCPSIFNFQRSRLLSAISKSNPDLRTAELVGLGRIELPTSPLSGVRSSQLSYRPGAALLHQAGGAGRDRTGDLLNANQALSQLSYSPIRPPSSGQKINRGQLDAETMRPAHSPLGKTRELQVEIPERAHCSRRSSNSGLEWNGCLLFGLPCTLNGFAFRKLHPRSLLERR